MKYFLIAGEASGDLHASQLIASLKRGDKNADFRFLGGDLMAQNANTAPIVHYRDMAFMGFTDVIKHLPQILQFMKTAKNAIMSYKPDALILIDYPSFNLKIAKFAKSLNIPVYYYISPKVWAWKEYRVKSIKKYVTKLFSILPFEPKFFKKHNYEVQYVGNPSVEEIHDTLTDAPTRACFLKSFNIDPEKEIIALLPGSRRSEISNNLPEMLKATHSFPEYNVIIAGAPGIEEQFYSHVIKTEGSYDIPKVIFDRTFELVKHSRAALVTSGTATLETAIVGTPQIVCYRGNASKLLYAMFEIFLKVKYISLPNLIAESTVVPELILYHCTKANIVDKLGPILAHSPKRDAIIEGYSLVKKELGNNKCAETTAGEIIKDLSRHESTT